MTDYTDAFSSDSIPPTGASFSSSALAENTAFFWPYNYSGDSNIIAKLMDVSCSAGVAMTMPPANQVSKGEDVLIRNTGAETLTVKKSDGTALTTVTSGTAVLLYVTDNSTAAGTWGSFVYGAGTASVEAGTLAGAGLTAISTTLNIGQEAEEQTTFELTSAQRGKVILFSGAFQTYSIPDIATFDPGYFVFIHNAGSGGLILAPYGAQKIDGVSSYYVPGNEFFGLAILNGSWRKFALIQNYSALVSSITLTNTNMNTFREQKFIPASEFTIDAGYGTAPTLSTLSLTNYDIEYLAFSDAANGRASFHTKSDGPYTGATTRVYPMWFRQTITNPTANVVWKISGLGYTNESAPTIANGASLIDATVTSASVTSAAPTVVNSYRFAEYSTGIGGTHIVVERDTTNASDDMTGETACLIGVLVTYNRTSINSQY